MHIRLANSGFASLDVNPNLNLNLIVIVVANEMQKIITNATTTSRTRTTTESDNNSRERCAVWIFMELVIFMQIAKSQSKLSQRFKKMTLKCCYVEFASLSPDLETGTPTLTAQVTIVLSALGVCMCV